MTTYKTPDVYVEEISSFPPSVAEVETAIPAFIGYTEKTEKNGENLKMKPTKIYSMVEFKQYFGEGPPVKPVVKLDDTNTVSTVDLGKNSFYLYDSMRLYFDNGGGKCYVVSVGDYSAAPAIGDDSSGILGGLELLKKEDEPTILLCPDATLLPGNDLYQFQEKALEQCGKLMDRVTICDLKNSNLNNSDEPAKVMEEFRKNIEEFRDNIGIRELKYGASYTPWLKTSYTKAIKSRDVSLKRASTDGKLDLKNLTKDAALQSFITKELGAAVTQVDLIKTKIIDPFSVKDNKTLKERFQALVDHYNAGRNYDKADNFQEAIRAIYALILEVMRIMVTTFRDDITETTDFKLKTDLDTVVRNNQLDQVLKTLITHSNAALGFSDGKIFDDSEDPIDGNPDDTQKTRMEATIDKLKEIITESDLDINNTDPAVETHYTNADTPDAKGLVALGAAHAAFGELNTAVAELTASAADYERTFDNQLAERFALYKNIVKAINDKLSLMPPSGAVAGIYAYNDRTRGVWKAPANYSLTSVNGPSVKINSKEQEDLNVNVNAGKSINAIRAFSGKGTLIWGARTLAGNDNEWRYISVRRFFNMVEESVKKATYWAVFEPNDANTWIKLKAMIENYLIQKWRDGALQGVKPEHAFFVKVGLGETMTAQDILEGRMNIEIGMAVVRPAEFIILKFSHKMMES